MREILLPPTGTVKLTDDGFARSAGYTPLRPMMEAQRQVKSSSRQRIIIAVAVLVAVAAGEVWYQSVRLPKRFATVVEGRLYRSGEITPTQLERLKDEYGIGRVVSLLDPSADVSVAERAAAERLGIEWCNVPLRGNGESRPADRERILAFLTDPAAPPTLVHCAAGVNRTGLAVGLYRLHCQDWTLEQVRAEMLAFDFEDLPKHENLRQALAAEAQTATSRPVEPTVSNGTQPPSTDG